MLTLKSVIIIKMFEKFKKIQNPTVCSGNFL